MNNFEELYNEYIDMIYRICLMYLKNTHDAEEVTQDVFMKYLRYLPDFENKDHAKRWFIKTTANTCKNVLKSSWFKKIICFDSVPESINYKKEDTILQEILELPYKYKISIYLFYYEGYRTDEISNILNMNPSTVRSNLSRARKKLKLSLEDDFSER